ncbi:hypothetical protein [Streptomyces sp. NPDC050704]|uniref:cupin domain-containing protein n=1 Tax=Streptomyces sp. NPDC050704 TaxID=3157219 RepID=UPI00342BA2B4
MTERGAATTVISHDGAVRQWRSVARRGMLFSECESIDHVVLKDGGTLSADPEDSTEALWYVVSGQARFQGGPGGTAHPVSEEHAVLVPAGVPGLLSSTGTCEVIVMTCVPDSVARRLPQRAPSLDAPTADVPGANAYRSR